MLAWLRLENLDGISLVPRRGSYARVEHRFIPVSKSVVRKEILMLMAGGQAELLSPRASVPGDYGDWRTALTLADRTSFMATEPV